MKKMFTPKSVVATILLLVSLVFTNRAISQQGIQTFNASGTFTVPVGVTQITVKAWGGGGAGGTSTTRSGGGGGAYATKTFSVTSGTAYNVTVGAGGTISPTPAVRDGKASSFGTDVIAVGGTGASTNPIPGVGGQASACTPTTGAFSGGNGGGTSTTSIAAGNLGFDGGGGGGGSATASGNGGNGGSGGNTPNGCTAGTSGTGQGSGGTGGDCSGNNATPGAVPGGGGGGQSEAANNASATGAAGQVMITYTCPAATISYSPSSYCSNGSPVSPVITGSMGGTFSAQPNGLSINPSTGVITPSSSTPGTYTVRYQIASTGGCPAVDATATVTVFQAVGGTVNLPNSTVCSGQSSSINIIVTPATGGTFSGTFTNGRSFTNLAPAAGVISPTYTFINNGVANVVENFTLASLTYTDNASGITCSATSTGGSTNITIQPVPDLMATLNTPAIVCNGGAVSISITNPNLVGGTYNRQTNYNGAGHTAAMTAVGQTYPGSFSDVLTNTTASPITVVYTFAPISQGSPNCQGTPVNVSVTVNPNPTVTCPASPTVSTALNACSAVVNGIDPVSSAPATCNGTAPTITYSATGATTFSGTGSASGKTFNKGITTVTYTITDALNNTGTCQFTVTVNDNQAPAISCPPTVSVNNTTGQCGTIVNYPAQATTTDNCPGTITITYSPASGTYFPVGITVVTATATDAANNSSNCTFNVVVADNEAPVISCPANISVNNTTGQCGAAVTFAATATDNCTATGNIAFSYSPASGSVFPVGTTTVTATATDAAGNASNCTFTVTVADNEAPVITCPATVTANNGADGCTAVVNYPNPATATDNCTAPGSIQFTYSPASGSTFNVGTTPVTVTATDAAGNFSTCTFNVIVNNTTGNLYVNDGSTAGDTLTTAIGNDMNGNGTKCKPFATIQKAVSVATAGNTIYVDAGTYPEFVDVNKALSFRGAKAGGDPRATGTGSRPGAAGESIIVPPVVDTTNAGGTLFTLSANNISFDGFTFNGNNPALAGGQPVNGVNIQASRAFVNLQSPLTAVNNISVKNNVLKNFYRTGFYLQGVGPAAPQQNNVVDVNVFDNIHRFSGTSTAVYLEQESTTDVTNNLMTRVGRGAFTATISGNATVPFSFSNNNITSYFTGVWVNNHYGSTPVCTIANNTLATESGAASNDGIRITSMQTSAQVLVNNNTITPSRYGYYLWNCPTTSTITLNGGSVTGGARGVNASNIYPGFGDASPSNYIVDNVTIQNSTTAGVYVDDNNANANNSAVSVTIRNSTLISNATTGLLISGANASAAFSTGTPPAAFTGQAKYIAYTSNGTDVPATNITATAVTFDGQTGATATLAQNFAIEDKIDHKTDLATLGFVLVKANNDFVTTASFVAPNTVASLQRGVDVAGTGFTVNLANGVYNGDVDVNKTVIVRGQSQAAVIRGLYAGNSKSVRVSASNATVKNVTITRDYGTTLADWYASAKTEGIIIENVNNVTLDSALVTGNRTGVFVHSVPGFIIKNSIIRDNRTGFQMFGDLSSGQIINNFITNNFTHGVLINFDQGPTNAQNLAVNNNNISGNWYSQIDFQNNGTQGTNVGSFTGSNFNCNWYGTVNPDYAAVNAGGPGYTSQVPAQFGGTDPGVNADIRGKEAALITYIPYLTNGADANAPDSLNGFNPVSSCNGTPVVIASAVPSPETCGGNNGSVTVTFNGGTGPYSLSYTGPSSGGPTTITSPATISNLAAGTYSITITDANGIFATTQAVITYNPVTNVTQTISYTTIQGAVNAANAGDSITVCSGTYNEQVVINKALKLQGLGPVKPVINYTGVPAVTTRPTLFDVTAAAVTIRGFEFRVNMTQLGSAIIASAANVSNLSIQNNDISPYQSTVGTYGPAYGRRNAVSINYDVLRVNGSNPVDILATGNMINYFDNGTPSGADDIGFRSGFDMDEATGTFDNNTIKTINQDIQSRFASAGSLAITNNNINGGGIEIAESNAGAGTFTVSGNTFNGTFGSTFTSALRLKNNTNAKATTVSGNTFTGHNWGISLENYKSAIINNNVFTPSTGSATYRHITVNTKELSSSSGAFTPSIDGTFTNNTFNGSGAAGGLGLAFYNQDNDSPVFGTFTIGTAGNENNFNAGVGTFIYLDNNTGTTAPNTTPTAPFPANLDATNNKFDVGAGLQLPTAMSLANLFLLEDKVQHKIDAATLGFVLVKANNTYVTPNSFVAPNTAPSVQRGADAAGNNFIVNVKEGTYNDNLAINKNLTFQGAQTGVTGTASRPVESILIAPTSGSSQLISISGTGTSVAFDGFKFDGKNIGNVVDGTQKLYIRNTIAELDFAPASNNLYASSDSLVLTNNYFKAEVGTNDGSASHIFSSATNLVARGNTFTSADALGQLTGGTTSLPVWLNVTTNTQKAVVDSNLFTTIDIGVLLGANASNVTISNNDFTDAKRNSRPNNSGNGYGTGIALFETLTGTGNSINNNNFTNSETGIRSSAAGAGPYVLPAGLGVHYNSFTNISDTSIRLSAAFTGTLDATCNWFGTTSANAIDATTSNQVVYSPYLLDGTDNSPARGFQTSAVCNGTLIVIASTVPSPETCGSNNGSIVVTFSGGTSPYNLAYSGPSSGSQTNVSSPATISGLAAGTYTVTITDANNSSTTTTATITYNPVTNVTQNATYTSIQAAVTAANANDSITVCSGTYNEQVAINKPLKLQGLGSVKPVINYTGTPANTARATLFDVTAPSVTIRGFEFRVNMTRLGSAIIASAANVSNLAVQNNDINPYQSTPGTYGLGYGLRNAVAINYAGLRINGANPVNILATGNTISYVNGSTPVGFRSGFDMDEATGTFDGNTIQSINQDIQSRFASAGSLVISNNNINGGGVEISESNAGAGTFTVSGNTFNGTFGSTFTSALRLKNNTNAKATTVSGNTFTGHNWGISLENYQAVTVNNNVFTPASGSTTYRHITVDTKEFSSSSGAFTPNINGTFTNNTFNGSGASGGLGLAFYNEDNDNPVIGPFTVGTTGNENNFNAGVGTFIYLDNTTGTTNPNATPTAPFNVNLDATNNKFDVGAGLQLPTAMSLSNLFSLEDKVQHKIDATTLGFVLVKASNTYVTPNSFVAPNTTPKVQRGVDAAGLTGFIENVQNGTYIDNVLVNKGITVTGQSQAGVVVIPAISSPGGSGSLPAGSSNVFLVDSTNVTIQNLTVDGNNPALTGIMVNGSDVDARSGIITNHNRTPQISFNGLNVNNVTVQNVYYRGIYSSTDNTFSFTNNTVTNVAGDPASVAMLNFGGAGFFTNNAVTNSSDGIASNNSTGTIYSGNTVTGCASGIHSDNAGSAAGISTPDSIRNNTVTNGPAGSYGIYLYLPYVAPVVQANTVTNVEVGLANFSQVNNGPVTAVTPLFTQNTVDGQSKANSVGVFQSTDEFGGNAPAIGVSGIYTNNFIRNNSVGFKIEYQSGRTNNITANNNSITSNTIGVQLVTGGTLTNNFNCNWWGSNNAAAVATAVGQPSNVINYIPYLSDGTDLQPGMAGFQPSVPCATCTPLSATATQTATTCANGSDGAITVIVNAPGGTTPYSYTIAGPTVNTTGASSGVFTGLSQGTYTITIFEATGCSTALAPVTVKDQVAPMFTNCPAPVTGQTPNMNGCQASLTPPDPTATDNCTPPVITYVLSNATTGSGTAPIGAMNFNVGTTTITYTATDQSGNTATCTTSVTVINNQKDSISGTATVVQNNATTSNITFYASGGTGPYTFTYNVRTNGGSPGPNQTVNTTGNNTIVTVPQSNAVVGQYIYTLVSGTDMYGCPAAIASDFRDTIIVTATSTRPDFVSSVPRPVNSAFINAQVKDGYVQINNVATVPSTGQITFRISNMNNFMFNFPANMTTSGGDPVNNSDWIITPGAFFYTVTSKPGAAINGGTFSRVGFTLTATGNSNSQGIMTVTILNDTGGSSVGAGDDNNTNNQSVKLFTIN